VRQPDAAATGKSKDAAAPAGIAAMRRDQPAIRPDPLRGDHGPFAIAERYRKVGNIIVALEHFRPLEDPVCVENTSLRIARHLTAPLRLRQRDESARRWSEGVIGPGQHFVFQGSAAASFDWRSGFRALSITLLPGDAAPVLPAPAPPVAIRADDIMLERLTGALLQECLEGFPRGDAFLEAIGLALAAHEASGGSLPRPVPPLRDAELRRAQEAVEHLIGESFTLSDLARQVGVPLRRLSGGFRGRTGRPLWAYVLERRVAHAESLLRDTGMPLAEIALACGFSGQPHLTTAFRRLRGITPGAWRRAARAG
jgi:AraC-like DNA-binding protein